MAFGLPVHLLDQASSRAFSRALHAAAATCLVAAFLAVLAFQASEPTRMLWPAGIALLPMGLLLWLRGREATLLFRVGYLIVGGAAAYWYIMVFSSNVDATGLGDALFLPFPKIALVLVGGAFLRLAPAVGWATAGLAVAEFASVAVAMSGGVPYAFDAATFFSYVVAVGLLVTAADTGRRSRRTPTRLHRAARDDRLAEVRYRLELKAAALLHDTVLSHLAAIAGSASDELDPGLRRQMARDLETLIGEEWLDPAAAAADSGRGQDWRGSALYAAIVETRRLGLDVRATGDLALVARLGPASSAAVGMAVKQCLVNVLKHSGRADAEVAVYGSDAEISIMVVDEGRGFVESTTASDRLGLRNSVRGRIASVGGSVQIFSTLGRGTSVTIRVPVNSSARVDSAESVRP